MNDQDLENLMAETPLKAPTGAFDRRMMQLFASSPGPRPYWFKRPVPVWLVALCLLMVGIGGYFGGARRAQSVNAPAATTPIVYIIQNDSLDRTLDATGRRPGFLSQPGNLRIQFHGAVESAPTAKTNPI